MSRLRSGLVSAAVLISATAVLVVAPGGIAAATDPGIDTGCAGTLSGGTFTLTADCDTTVQLTVPDGLEIDGADHTITAHDPGPGIPFSRAVLTNDPTGHSMTIENLTVLGTGFAVNCSGQILTGIFFNDARGSLSDVVVQGITQDSGCPLRLGIRANATAGVARTVTIANAVVSGYQKSALVASGLMTTNVSASTFGPPDQLPPSVLTQNGVQYGGTGVNAGAGGTISQSTIYGSGFGHASEQGTAVLLYGTSGVTLSQDTITGAGTDIGVDATPNSSDVVVNGNQIGRTAPDGPDSIGIGVQVTSGSTATVTCNSFIGWVTNVTGAPSQPVCFTTATLPAGNVHTYSATLAAVGGTAPYTWSLATGFPPT